MSKINVSQLSHANNSGDSNIQLFADGSTSISNLLGIESYRPNMLINGGMTIKQRLFPVDEPGQDGYFPVVATPPPTYSIDRWGYWKEDTPGEVRIYWDDDDLPPGVSYAYSANVSTPTTGAGNDAIAQSIEGIVSSQLGWGTSEGKSLSVSFWARTNVPGTYAIYARTANYVSVNLRCCCMTYEIPNADEWTYVEVTFPPAPEEPPGSKPWNTNTSRGLEIGWTLYNTTDIGEAGSWNTSMVLSTADCVSNWLGTAGNYFKLTGCAANTGTKAIPYAPKAAASELLDCQRYYFETPLLYSSSTTPKPYTYLRSSYAAASMPLFGRAQFPVAMRQIPSVTLIPGEVSSGTGSAYSVGYTDNYGVTYGASQGSSANAQAFVYTGLTASAEF
jgi:hypothetical protein